MLVQYDKLVRDRIPEMIKTEGLIPQTRILSGAEYSNALTEKLTEEVKEYLSDKNTEELADILEVVYALAQANGISEEQLNRIRQEKREKRGGFEKRVWLISKTDET